MSGADRVARRRAFAVWGLATLAGGSAAVLSWCAPSALVVVVALLVHAVAALLTARAVRLAHASSCEADLALMLSLVAPFVGGLFSVVLLRPRVAGVCDAHAAHDLQVEPPGSARRPDADRELQVESHAHVLRHGSLEQKRNLLRMLGRIGEPRHVGLLRRFLRDPEPELRLCAYAELARIGEAHEQRIRELRLAVERLDGAQGAAIASGYANQAEACHAYATSGALDEDMAEFWLDQAGGLAERALGSDTANVDAQRVFAMVLAERGRVGDAWQIVRSWPDGLPSEFEELQAELAFRRRDRGTCVEVAARLQQSGVGLPDWLAELTCDPAESPARTAEFDVDARLRTQVEVEEAAT